MRHPAPMPDGLPLHLDDVPTDRWEIGELAATRRRLGAAAGAQAARHRAHADRPGQALDAAAQPRRRGRALPRPGGQRAELAVLGVARCAHVRDRRRRHALAPVERRRAHADRGRRGAHRARRRRGLALEHHLAAADAAVLARAALVAGRLAAAVPRRRRARAARAPGARGRAPADDPQPRRPAAQRGPRGERSPTRRATPATWAPTSSCSRRTRCRPTPTTPTCTSTPRARRRGSSAAGAASRGSATTRTSCAPARSGCGARTPASATGSRSGPEGMELVTMGDLIPGDVVVYPEKRTFKPARGVELPY